MCPYYCCVVVRHVHIEVMRWPWVTRETLGVPKANKSMQYVDALLWPEILKSCTSTAKGSYGKTRERERERERTRDCRQSVIERKKRKQPRPPTESRNFQSFSIDAMRPSSYDAIDAHSHKSASKNQQTQHSSATQPSVFLARGCVEQEGVGSRVNQVGSHTRRNSVAVVVF